LRDPRFAKTTNRDLIARCAEAGPEDPAWPEFFARFHGRLRLIVYRSLVAEASRAGGLDVGSLRDLHLDLVQEAYLKLLAGERRALARFRGRSESSIYTYLASIAVNVVRDHFKKLRALKSPRAALSLDGPGFAADGPLEGARLGDRIQSPGPSPEDAARASELRRQIEQALEQATRGGAAGRDRLVFRLYFLERLSIDEIAACRGVGLTSSGVEKCVRRLREAVRKVLGADFEG
jgi:RNA polymerase sigma factor (sigma-70 family)